MRFRRVPSGACHNQQNTPTHLSLLLAYWTAPGQLSTIRGRSILAQVKTKLLAPCQLFPIHGKRMPSSDAAGYDRFSFRQPHGRQPVGEKDSMLEALLEQTDWDDSLTERWPGPDAGRFCGDYQMSPTQPMTGRAKAAPTTLGQTVSSEIAAAKRFRCTAS